MNDTYWNKEQVIMYLRNLADNIRINNNLDNKQDIDNIIDDDDLQEINRIHTYVAGIVDENVTLLYRREVLYLRRIYDKYVNHRNVDIELSMFKKRFSK